jgi:hypothetical protein
MNPGTELLSHARWNAVPSPLEGLTSGFGMGPGVTPPLWAPRNLCVRAPRTLLRDNPITSADIFNQALGPLVPVSSTHCCASTSGLSTQSSSWGPYLVNPVGDLISESASHLDAFSAYPFRTWLTSRAAGATTGTPEVRPSRSSRTRDSSPQVSCARRG